MTFLLAVRPNVCILYWGVSFLNRGLHRYGTSRKNPLLLFFIALAPIPVSGAGILEYRMLVDGSDAPLQYLSPGTHTLTVEGRVTDNELAPGIHGGIFQYSFSLDDATRSLSFAESTKVYGGITTSTWDSTANSNFNTHFQGIQHIHDDDPDHGNHNYQGFEVIAETGAFSHGRFNTAHSEVGANVFSFLTSGEFEFDGSSTILTLGSPIEDNVVFGWKTNGSLGLVYPFGVIGDSVSLHNYDDLFASATENSPEPCTALLGALASVGVLMLRSR